VHRCLVGLARTVASESKVPAPPPGQVLGWTEAASTQPERMPGGPLEERRHSWRITGSTLEAPTDQLGHVQATPTPPAATKRKQGSAKRGPGRIAAQDAPDS